MSCFTYIFKAIGSGIAGVAGVAPLFWLFFGRTLNFEHMSVESA